MNRRDTVFALMVVCLTGRPLVAAAQTPRKVWRVGLLSPLDGVAAAGPWDEFRRGLREVGYTEGQNVAFEERNADGKSERLAEFAAELVRLNVDVILTLSTNAAIAAHKATATIPIVFVGVGGDPVANGFADSLSRPGRNMTGLSNFAGDLGPKRLELLKLLIPKLSRIALLVNPSNPYSATTVPRMRPAADAFGVKLLVANWNAVDNIDTVFAKVIREGAQAIVISADVYHSAKRKQISDAAIKHRVATIAPSRNHAETGILLSYGTDPMVQYRRAAAYADKIFKGDKPGDLPIEQPATFELVINLKTAKVLGIKIPQSILVRADRVIE